MGELILQDKILEKFNKTKEINKLAKSFQIPANEMLWLVLRYQVESKYKNLEEMIKKLGLENEELLRNPFNLFNHNYSDKLVEELKKIINEDDLIDDFYGGSGGSGDSNWIVLTPFYVSEMMARILEVDKNSIVLDNCCGAGALLNGALTTGAGDVLGVEYDANMWVLAYLSLALRLNKKPSIVKGDAFKETSNFKNQANVAIINPPYNYEDNGMPFILEALNNLKEGGRAAIIVQASAGNGKAKKTNEKILEKHSLVGSIKMSDSLFKPFASVATCIYFFKAHVPHNFENQSVTFADLSNDGIKKTSRSIRFTEDTDKLYGEVIERMASIWK